MSARISATGRTIGVWPAVLMATATAINADSAYLPVTGPPPLRFEVAMTRTFDFSTVGKNAVPPPKTEAVSVLMEPAHGSTNAAATVVSITESNGSVLSVALPNTAPEESVVPEPPVAPHPADNLLVITPQMLAEYFKPFPGATNAAGVSVFLPVQIGFTPPTDKAPVASRATYKVQ